MFLRHQINGKLRTTGNYGTQASLRRRGELSDGGEQGILGLVS